LRAPVKNYQPLQKLVINSFMVYTKSVFESFQKIIFKITTWTAVIALLTLVLFPSMAFAQESQSQIGGFKECDFSFANDSSTVSSLNNGNIAGQNTLQSCLTSIMKFAFILGIFLIAFRVGLSAFNNFNPNQSGTAINDSIKLVYDIMIGLILIGAPSLIVLLINPAANNLDFLNFSKFTQTVGLVGPTTSAPASTASPSTANTGASTANTSGNTSTFTKETFTTQLDKCKSNIATSTASECKTLLTEINQIAKDCPLINYGFVDAKLQAKCKTYTDTYGKDKVAQALALLPAQTIDDAIKVLAGNYIATEDVVITLPICVAPDTINKICKKYSYLLNQSGREALKGYYTPTNPSTIDFFIYDSSINKTTLKNGAASVNVSLGNPITGAGEKLEITR
jgi:hypothetical protein